MNIIEAVLVLTFCAMIFIYGLLRRAQIPSLAISTKDIRISQGIRFFSAVTMVALLLYAVSINIQDMFAFEKTGVITYAFDESRSSGAQDSSGISRIRRAKKLALDIDKFPHTIVSAYGFTDRASSQSSFSDSHEQFRKTVEFLVAIEAVPGSGSDLGFSLINIIEDTSRECDKLKKRKPCMVVFFSDGENIGDQDTLIRAVKLAERSGIKIIAVGIGEDNPSRIPVYEGGFLTGYEKGVDGRDYLTDIYEETLKFIAGGSGGIYIKENEAGKAVNFIDKNLDQEKIEIRAEANPISVYLLLASFLPLAIFRKYSTV